MKNLKNPILFYLLINPILMQIIGVMAFYMDFPQGLKPLSYIELWRCSIEEKNDDNCNCSINTNTSSS